MGSTVTTIKECLTMLDVQPVAEGEAAALDRDGFVVLEDVLTPDEARAMIRRLDELKAEEGEKAGSEFQLKENSDLLGNLIDKDPIFEICLTHPRVLGAIAHVLDGEFKLFAMNARNPHPGAGHQALHADWHESVEPGDYRICNSIWMLDAFTEQNGPTRIVPGTHRSGVRAQDALEDPEAPHPDEIKVTGRAGTVAIFNSHVWHGGTRNATTGSRHAITTAFCRREEPQQYDIRSMLRPETYARLSDAARYLLDV